MKTLAAVAIGLGCMIAPALANNLIINNTSRYDIHELYVSKSKSSQWGPDQLRRDTVEAGSKFTLRGVTDGTWDLKLVDEDGTECVVEDVDFDESKEWTVTSRMLERCDKFGN